MESKPTAPHRLRRACDACSSRKVKCDEKGPPCKACQDLNIPCTFERPSRRRGPPNKHAESLKRRRSPGTGSGLSPPSSPRGSLDGSTHSIEAICPFSTLELLVDDYFTYIHPLIPIPHEPTFRSSLQERRDQTDSQFLSLVAAMVGILVASFPRKPQQYLKYLVPNSMVMIRQCHEMVLELRGIGYLDRELNVYDSFISYLLGLTSAYTFEFKRCRLYMGECHSIARTIGLCTPSKISESRELPENSGRVDHVLQELGRRLYWLLVVGSRTLQQLGNSFTELIVATPSTSGQYPALPSEVDDEYISRFRVGAQPAGIVSRLTGFNFNVRVYISYDPVSLMELTYGIDHIFDLERQKRFLIDALKAVKKALEVVPKELSLRPGDESGEFEMASPLAQADQERRKVQYEIQKANIYASQLGTRSYINEKYWNLCEMSRPSSKSPQEYRPYTITPVASPEDSTGSMLYERESIVKDLLMLLRSINQVNMEPNGASVIHKIRLVASTLLESPESRKGEFALEAEQYLVEFVQVLMKLERLGVPSADESDEELELQHWADLRENQIRFAENGGILSQL